VIDTSLLAAAHRRTLFFGPMLRLLARAVLCTVFLLVPSSALAQDAPVATTAPDPSLIGAIESQVTALRGLQPLREIDLRVLDEEALRAYLLQAFDRDYLPHEREADQKSLVALGLLKPTEDLIQIKLDLYAEQVIGVYDPDDKAMFVVGEGVFGPGQRLTFAHEFHHALQDQHYDLNRIAPPHPDSNDRSLAVHALIEGDAVLLQALWAASHLTQDELIELARDSAGGSEGLARAPLIVRTELLFPYIEGLSFVRQAYREAGNSFSAVDALYATLPESTSHILHPDKYRSSIAPAVVQLPDVTAQLGPEWRRVGEGVLGELYTRVLLEQYGDRLEASRVAAGWSGDRWLLMEHEGRSTMVVKSTWETETAAQSFFGAYGRGLRKRFDAAMTEDESARRQALSTPTAATDLRVSGRDVLAVISFDRASSDAAIAALTSAGAL
jgi:hypothetical protein